MSLMFKWSRGSLAVVPGSGDNPDRRARFHPDAGCRINCKALNTCEEAIWGVVSRSAKFSLLTGLSGFLIQWAGNGTSAVRMGDHQFSTWGPCLLTGTRLNRTSPNSYVFK